MEARWSIVGHQKQRDFLSRAAALDRLSHAYVFCGPAGIGKKSVAVGLAKILLCQTETACGNCDQCRMSAGGSNPDLILVSESEAIKIEQIRELVYKMSLKSYSGGRKIAIIDSAELMTIEAANALLKALEEPTPGTHVLLITSNAQRLLPTISSRAQKINFGLVPPEQYRELLPADLDSDRSATIMDMSAGRPGMAVKILNDPEFSEIFEGMEKFYQSLSGTDLAAKIESVYELSERESYEIRLTLEHSLNKLEREILRFGACSTAKKAAGVSACLKYLAANVNPKLFLFNLLLNT